VVIGDRDFAVRAPKVGGICFSGGNQDILTVKRVLERGLGLVQERSENWGVLKQAGPQHRFDTGETRVRRRGTTKRLRKEDISGNSTDGVFCPRFSG